MTVLQARMAWIRDGVDPDLPHEPRIVVGIDRGQGAGLGDRVVARLLARAMEGDEGVFWLLPHDLCCTVSRSGALVEVRLYCTLAALTWDGTLDAGLWAQARAAGLIPPDARVWRYGDDSPYWGEDAPVQWVRVLSAEIAYPEDAAPPGLPLVVVDHDGAAGLDDLLTAVPESGVHLVGPRP